jgi:hypothetical protein
MWALPIHMPILCVGSNEYYNMVCDMGSDGFDVGT